MCAFVLGLPEQKVRVIAPDVGGGFGSKIFLYAEDVGAGLGRASASAGRSSGPPSAAKSFLTDAHGRDHVTKAELAHGRRGQVPRAARQDASPTWAPTSRPSRRACRPSSTRTLLAGQYTTPAIYVRGQGGVHQHRAGRRLSRRRPARGDLRGRAHRRAGGARDEDRPGRDPAAELHHRRFPYRRRSACTYDTGNYAAHLDKRDRDGRRRRLPGAQGGVARPRASCAASATPATSRPAASRRRTSPARSARAPACSRRGEVRVHPTGTRHGLHRLAQPRPGPRDHVRAGRRRQARHPDRATSRSCTATPAASRSAWAPTARARSRSAARRSSRRSTRSSPRARRSPRTCWRRPTPTSSSRTASSRSPAPTRRCRSAQVALTAYVPHNYPLDKLEPGLNENAFYDPTNFTYPAGTLRLRGRGRPGDRQGRRSSRFTAVDDFGNIVNPMIVEGQVHGGLAQGIGQAMLEGCAYDPRSGQLLTGSFMDYAMPRADDLPNFTVDHDASRRARHNPLGREGLRRGRRDRLAAGLHQRASPTRSASTDIAMPATPERVWRAAHGLSSLTARSEQGEHHVRIRIPAARHRRRRRPPLAGERRAASWPAARA